MQRSNEEALDLFADLLDPAAEIILDNDIISVFRNGGKPIDAVKAAIKNHKAAVIEILALIDDVPVEDYRVNVLALPVKLLRLFNQPEIKELFIGQSQKSAASSGSAMENTEDGAN